jgi:Arc/MetJ-type ribon-helix-helix transcriptional regulator
MYMTLRKTRLTVTVDADLVAAANAAVARGESDSVSAYVNKALSVASARERRLAKMDEAIAMYEAEFGKIYYPDGTVRDVLGNSEEER